MELALPRLAADGRLIAALTVGLRRGRGVASKGQGVSGEISSCLRAVR
jgi:hypothetical protein